LKTGIIVGFLQVVWYYAGDMEKQTTECLRQCDYDMETAEYMHQGGRHIYAVFMCHLAMEKALKGLYYEKRRNLPPKSHNLIYLLNEIGIKPPDPPGKFIVQLSEASIPTRYPENLARLQETYSESAVKVIISRAREAIAWIKAQL
jgi:HEPN domain-containing protein